MSEDNTTRDADTLHNITWVTRDGWTGGPDFEEVFANGKLVGSLEPRQHYCDRGRWIFRCELGGLDAADGFPRYYMFHDAAVAEIEAWLRWRLWKQHAPRDYFR